MKLMSPEEGYDQYAPHYRKDHAHLDSFDWDLTRDLLREALTARIDACRTGHESPPDILELGCGDGRVLKRIHRMAERAGWFDEPGIRLTGWDISSGMLARAKKNLPAHVALERRDILAPIATPDSIAEASMRRFDIILAFFLLVHIPEPRLFFEAAVQLLAALPRKGTLFLNTFPQRSAPILETAGHRFRIEYYDHSEADILSASERAGLCVSTCLRTPHSIVFGFTFP